MPMREEMTLGMWPGLFAFLVCTGAMASTVSVDPPSSSAISGQIVTVSIKIAEVSDLYAWQFDLGFDPTVLSALDVTEGAFLATGGSTFFLSGAIDNSAGSITFNSDTLETAISGVNGGGELAQVRFETISAGSSALGLANVLLVDSGLNPIDAATEDGTVTVTPEPSGLAFSVFCLLVLLSVSWAVRRGKPHRGASGAQIISVLGLTVCAAGHVWGTDISTAQFDASRTMANTAEVYLTTSSVTGARFGKLFSRNVDGAIFAQPLYLQGMIVASKKINLLYVVTSHDNVYAFDADNAGATAPVWSVSLGPYETPSGWPVGMGILSTPLIVRSSGTMYVTAATFENGARVYRLHALDLLTGAEKAGSPVVISGTVPGTSGDSGNGVISFDPNTHVQRAGLALSGNNVVVGFGPDRDHPPYHGWIFSYNTGTLHQTGIFNDARNNTWDAGTGAGIWQSGRAPAVDASGALYFETGNGDYDGALDFGESFLKLTSGSGGLALSDWFTPSSWQTLNALDYDLGSTGPTLIPGTNLVFGGSKTGTIYLLSTTSLGQLSPGDANIVQSFTATSGCAVPFIDQGCAQIMGQVFWPSAPVPTLYVWGIHDVLRSYQFSGGRFNTVPGSVGTGQAYYPGGLIALSSYQGIAGTGIIWALTCDTPDNDFYFGAGFNGTATLHAFDANNLAHELWNSGQSPLRDGVGTFGNFSPPVAVNGKVYVPTFSNQLVVYGLLTGPVPGDVNGDSAVNCTDMSIVKASYGKASGQVGFDLRADVNGDGIVNILDLATVSRQLQSGTACQ